MFVVTASCSEFCCFSPFSHLSLDQSFLLYQYLQTSSLCFFLLLGSVLLLAGLCLIIPFFPLRQRKGGTLALFSPNLLTWRLSFCSPGLHINLFVLILFVYFWLSWVFVAALVLSRVTASRGRSRVAASGHLTAGHLLLRSTALGHRAPVVSAPRLQNAGSVLVSTGSAAPQHVGSSWIRGWTCVSCTGWQILHHGATRKTLDNYI